MQPGEKAKILIVDDDPSILRTTKRSLERTGQFEVQTEDTCERARGLLTSFKPDLVLLDVVMPGIDGGDLAAYILEHGLEKLVRVIFFTGEVPRSEIESHNGMIGGQEFISKPVERDELIARIDRRLQSEPNVYAQAAG